MKLQLDCRFKNQRKQSLFEDARAAGVEPATYGFGDRHSAN